MSRIHSVTIEDDFWQKRTEIVRNDMLPFQWRVLNDQEPKAAKSGVIHNFKIAAGLEKGEFYGMVFQDTDLYKWLEAVAYSLSRKPDKQLRRQADSAIDLIAAAQLDDGYIDTYFQVKVPQYRWSDLADNHELYSAGHLIEAGVAYYQATKNEKIYQIITKLADGLVARFGEGKRRGVPGHPEIELALIRLYRLTNRRAYLDLARYFVLERGKSPNYFIEEASVRKSKNIPSWIDLNWHHGMIQDEPVDTAYLVASRPLLEQNHVEGHAVRAGYLYSALADLAKIDRDPSLQAASDRLWDNAVNRQMYIEGGLGATARNEGFSYEYDLPNETNYCETCAAVALIFWGKRMLQLASDAEYGDVIERALYNNCLGSMALDGKSFYYRNELEIWGEKVNKAARPKWHSCACCPPNLARLLLSLDRYIYHFDDQTHTLFVDQFIGSTIRLTTARGDIAVCQQSTLPWAGQVDFTFKQVIHEPFSFAMRTPSWSPQIQIELNGRSLYEGPDYRINRGYLILHRRWDAGDRIVIHFDMKPKLNFANLKVKQDAGKVAVTRGPLLYCAEEEDNGDRLWTLLVPQNVHFSEQYDENLLGGVVRLSFDGFRELNCSDALYSFAPPLRRTQPITLIPFYTRYNRKIGSMQVWLRRDV